MSKQTIWLIIAGIIIVTLAVTSTVLGLSNGSIRTELGRLRTTVELNRQAVNSLRENNDRLKQLNNDSADKLDRIGAIIVEQGNFVSTARTALQRAIEITEHLRIRFEQIKLLVEH